MANELGIRVKVNLDTSKTAMNQQMSAVRKYFKENPVEAPFTVNVGKTVGNINKQMKSIIKQVKVPEIALKFKINGKEIGAQIKSTLQRVADDAFNGSSSKGGSKRQGTDITKQVSDNIKKVLALRKEMANLDYSTIGMDSYSNKYKETVKQISDINKEYTALKKTLEDSYKSGKMTVEQWEALNREEKSIADSIGRKGELKLAELIDKEEIAEGKALMDLYNSSITQALNTLKEYYAARKEQAKWEEGSEGYNYFSKEADSLLKTYNTLRKNLLGDGKSGGLLPEEEATSFLKKQNELVKSYQALQSIMGQMGPTVQNNGKTYDDIAVKIERLNAQIDYQRKVLEQYKSVGVDTSYANTLIQSFENFNTGEAGKGLDGTTRLRALQDASTSLNAEMARLSKQYSDVTTKQQNVAKSANNLAAELNRILQDNPRIRNNTELYSNFVEVINRLNHVDVKDQQGFAKLQVRASSLKSEFIQLGLNTDTLYTKLSRLFTEHFQTALVMAGIHGIQQGLQEVIANVSNLDHALVELRKVTDETENAYNQFLDSAAVKARELGTSIADYTESAAEWAQGGYTFEEADQLAYVATLYKNVGDGIDSAAQSSEYLISILRGFGLQAEDALSVVDKINEVSNKTAISAQGLGEALTRSAAALSSAGNDLDESLALAAGANSIIQDPDRVGNGLRSIALFLRAAKTEAEELGVETEGMASSVSELREDVMAIAGVDIMADEAGTQFKSTIDILRELSEVWDSLSDIDQANLTEMLIGKHQANIFVGLMQSMEDVETAYSAALNSVGSASEENEKYLDSISGKTAQLSSAFEQLSNTLINSDIIKFFLDLGIGATDAANGIAELTGVLPILTTALSTLTAVKLGAFEGFLASSSKSNDFIENVKALSTMQTVLGQTIGSINTKMVISSPPELDDFIAKVSTLTDSQKSLALSLIDWQAGSKEANIALKAQAEATLGVTTATRAATVAQLAWNTAIAAFKTIGIGLAIGAITSILQLIVKVTLDHINAVQKDNEEMENAINIYSQMATELENLTNKSKETEKQIEELQSKGPLTITEEQDLENLEKENALLKQQIILAEERKETARENAEEKAIDAANTYNDSVSSIGISRSDVDAMGYAAQTNLAGTLAKGAGLDSLLAGYQQLIRLQKEATDPEDIVAYNSQINETKERILEQIDNLEAIQNALNEVGYENLGEEGKAAFDGINESIETTLSYLDQDYYFNIRINADEFEKERQEIIDYAQSMGADTMEVAVALLDTKNWTDDTNAFIKLMMEMGATAYQIADMMGIDFEEMAKSIGKTSPELTKMSEKLDEVQAAYQTVRTAIDEYNEYGLISADTLQELSALDSQYTACLYDENGQLLINQDTLANTQQSYADVASAIYKNIAALQIKNALENIEGTTVSNITDKNYELVKSYDDLTDEYSSTDVILTAINDKYWELARSGEVSAETLGNFRQYWTQQYQSITQATSALYEMSEAVYKDTDAQLNYKNQLDDTGKSQDDENNKIHDAIGAFADLYAAMKEYNTYGEISYSTLNTLLSTYPELSSCLVQNGDELTINTEALREQILAQLAAATATEDATNTSDEYVRMLRWLDEAAIDGSISLTELYDKINGVGAAMEESRSAVQGYDSALTSVMQELLSYDPTDGTFYDQDHINRIYEMESALAGFGDVLSYDTDTKQVQLDYEALKQRTLDAIDDEIERAQAAGDKVTEAMLTASYTAIKEGDKEAIDYWVETGEVLDAVSISLDEFQTNYNDLIDITEEYNQNGELSQDSWQKLMAMGPQFVACLEMEGDQLVFNKEAYLALYKAQIEFMAGILETLGADEELIQQLRDMANNIDNLDVHFGRSTDALEKYKEALSKLGDVFDSVLNLIDKGLEATQDNLQEAADNLQIIGDAIIDEIQDRIDALEEQKDEQDQYYEDEIGNLEDLKDAMEDANEEQERAIELARLQDALARAKANRTVRKYVEGQGYIWTTDEDAVKQAEQDLSDQIRDWDQEDANAAIDDQIDKIQQDQEEAGNAIDDQIAKLEELKDKYSEVMDLIGMDWDEYQAMLKAQAEASGMTLDEMEANLDDYKDSVVQNMKDVEEVSDTQEEIEGIRNFIDTLKEVWSVISTILDIIEILSGGTDFLTTLKKAIGRLFGGGETGEGEGVEGESGDAFTNVIDNAKNFFGNLADTFKTGFDGLLDKGGVFLEGLKTKFGTFFGNFNLDVGGFIDTVKNLFSGGWDKITTGASGFIQNLISKFSTGFPGIEQLASTFIQNVTGFFSNGFPQITNIVSTFFTNLPNIFSGGLSTVLSTVTGWLGNLGSIFSSGLGSLASTVSSIIGNLGGIGSALGSVGAAVGSAAPVVAAGAVAVGGAIIGNKVGNTLLENSDKHFDEGKYVQAGLENAVAGIFKPVESLINGIQHIGSLLGFASGTKSVPYSSVFNVDEKGPELLLKRPAQGRYTYLEAGDGVVPADMTKNIFAMAKNPDEWFRKQLKANSIAQTSMSGGTSSVITIGDIYINKPVGNSDQLALAIKQELPNKMRQELGKR